MASLLHRYTRPLILVSLLCIAGAGCNRGKKGDPSAAPAAPAAVASSDPDAHIFEKTKWIESCMKPCKRNEPPNRSAEDREFHCTVKCTCGLAHMTDPGPGPGQVHAPSVRWQSENDDQHRAGVKACLDRADAELAARHPG